MSKHTYRDFNSYLECQYFKFDTVYKDAEYKLEINQKHTNRAKTSISLSLSLSPT